MLNVMLNSTDFHCVDRKVYIKGNMLGLKATKRNINQHEKEIPPICFILL